MKLIGIYVAISVALCFSINGAYAADCKDIVSTLLTGQMTNIVPCIKKLGYQTGPERADHFYCIMKCMLMEAGILTQDGRVTVRQAVEFVLEKVPIEIMDNAFNEITKCQKHASADLLDPADKMCAKYAPLIQCSINVILNLCGK